MSSSSRVNVDGFAAPVGDDLDWQTRFQNEISAADTADACTNIFEPILKRFGVDCFASGEVDLVHRERSTFFVIRWPDAWRKFYLEAGLLQRDPLLEALKSRRAPFCWSELKRDREVSTDGKRLFDLAAQSGWTEGLVVPITRSETRVGLVSLVATERPAFTAREKAQLTLASVFFHQHVRGLTPAATSPFPEPPAGLTAREVECLAMVATGLSDRDIAQRLGIAATTAHEHVERAKRKLRAKTRASAVAIAVTMGIVKP